LCAALFLYPQEVRQSYVHHGDNGNSEVTCSPISDRRGMRVVTAQQVEDILDLDEAIETAQSRADWASAAGGRASILPLARWLVGSILVVAAVLKASDGSGIVSFADYRVLDQAIHYSMIQVELALAACCFSGIKPRATRAALITLFSSFALYALFLVLSGAESCGCFGAVKVNPWWTILLDITLLGVLFLWQPEDWLARVAAPRSPALFLASYAAVAIPVTAWLALNRPAELRADSMLADGDGFVILEPEHWKGQPLPIADHLNIGEELTAGEWVLLLYHHDCPKCQEAVPQYQELAERLAHDGSATHVALVETPPYASAEIHGPPLEGLAGRLSDQREWFVRTPVEIRLNDGIVVDVDENL